MALFLLRDHDRQQRLDAVNDAPHVDGNTPCPIVEIDVPHVAAPARGDTGIQERHVHFAVGAYGVVGHRLDRVPSCEVGRHTGHIEGLFAHLGDGICERGPLDICQDHLHAELGEHLPGGATNATGTTGHHRYFSSEVLHSSSLSRIHCGSRIAGPPSGAGSGSVHVQRTRAPICTAREFRGPSMRLPTTRRSEWSSSATTTTLYGTRALNIGCTAWCTIVKPSITPLGVVAT